MTILADSIALVERLIAAHDSAVAGLSATSDYDGWRKAHRAADEESIGALTAGGARVKKDWRGAVLKLAGVQSTSTIGLHGAMHNWLRGARDREARLRLDDLGRSG